MAVEKGVFHPSRLIVCAPFPSHPANLLTPTRPGAQPIEPPFSTCAPANLLTSTLRSSEQSAGCARGFFGAALLTSSARALRLRPSAFLLSHPGVWKLAALVLRPLRRALLRRALRAPRAGRRARASRPGGSCVWHRSATHPKAASRKATPSRQLNITVLIV